MQSERFKALAPTATAKGSHIKTQLLKICFDTQLEDPIATEAPT